MSKGNSGKGSGSGKDGDVFSIVRAEEVRVIILSKELEKLRSLKLVTPENYFDLIGFLDEIQRFNSRRIKSFMWNSLIINIGITVISLVAYYLIRRYT